MAETPLSENAAVSPVASPWGTADAPVGAPGAAPPARPVSPASEFAWGLISTLLLAGWIALWAGPLGAVALVGGVFVHEFGHLLVINWAGARAQPHPHHPVLRRRGHHDAGFPTATSRAC